MLFVIFGIWSIISNLNRYEVTGTGKRWSIGIGVFVLTVAAAYAGAVLTGAMIGVTALLIPALEDARQAVVREGMWPVAEQLIALPSTILAVIYVPKMAIYLARPRSGPETPEEQRQEPRDEHTDGIQRTRPARSKDGRDSTWPKIAIGVLCAILASGATIAVMTVMSNANKEKDGTGIEPLESLTTRAPTATPIMVFIPASTAEPLPTVTATPPYVQTGTIISERIPHTPTAVVPTLAPLDTEALIIAAFASCGGSFTGTERDGRVEAAITTIERGYRTIEELESIVRTTCDPNFTTSERPMAETEPLHPEHVYIEAYASCNGQYTGETKDKRYQTTKGTLEFGYQTIDKLQEIVERRCPGAAQAVAHLPVATPTPQPPPWSPTPTVQRRWPTATPRPSIPTPTPVRQDDPQELKELMLQLTNEHRIAAGVPPVTMGNNPAVQLHVEAALQGCYSSHWDRWGLKPNHRYTLTGGTGSDAENISGSDYCIKSWENYRAIQSMEQEVRETVQGWIDSPGHRRTLLDPTHTELNIGITNDEYNTVMAQQFASDYVQYIKAPTIDENGILTLSANVSDATLEIGDSVNIIIAYDPPPRGLTRGQLSYTYALCNPTRVAYVVEPLAKGWRYTDPEVQTSTVERKCVDPYQTPADRPGPESYIEASRGWADAKKASAQSQDVPIQVRRVTADKMTATASSIHLTADLSTLMNDHGPGIYTVLLWGRPDHISEPTPLSKQAIFWQTQPPADAPY